MLTRVEMDQQVTLFDQLSKEVGPVDSTVAAPHLFQKVAVPGICIDR